MSREPLNEQRRQILDRLADELGENFDNIIILVNTYEGRDAGVYTNFVSRGNSLSLRQQMRDHVDSPQIKVVDCDDVDGDG